MDEKPETPVPTHNIMLNQPASIRLIINGTEYRVRADGHPEDLRSSPAAAPAAPWPDRSAPVPPVPARQRLFAFSDRTALVSTEVVRAVLGVDAATVAGMVESGQLAWVFDVSASKGNLRELRYWTRELFEPGLCQMSPARALQLILGKRRQRWRGAEIEQLLLASRPTILRWYRSGDLPGELVGHTFWTTRESLSAFLTSRLCHRSDN